MDLQVPRYKDVSLCRFPSRQPGRCIRVFEGAVAFDHGSECELQGLGTRMKPAAAS